MLCCIFFCLGVTIIVIGLILLFNKINLYKKGVRSIGKVIRLDSRKYIEWGPDFNSFQNTVYVPIIEVQDDDKKIEVEYDCSDECRSLLEGQEVEIIYSKGKVESLEIYKDKNRYNLSIWIIVIGIILGIVGFFV